MVKKPNVEKSFAHARERYAEAGMEVNRALKIMAAIPTSFHCFGLHHRLHCRR